MQVSFSTSFETSSSMSPSVRLSERGRVDEGLGGVVLLPLDS